jgi:cell division protein FtsB
VSEENGKLSEAELKERHRDQAKRFERARYHATRRLIEAHKAEYARLHDEEKEKQGIKSRNAGAMKKVRDLFKRHPGLENMLTPQQTKALAEQAKQLSARDQVLRQQARQIEQGPPPAEDAPDPLAR